MYLVEINVINHPISVLNGTQKQLMYSIQGDPLVVCIMKEVHEPRHKAIFKDRCLLLLLPGQFSDSLLKLPALWPPHEPSHGSVAFSFSKVLTSSLGCSISTSRFSSYTFSNPCASYRKRPSSDDSTNASSFISSALWHPQSIVNLAGPRRRCEE